MTVVLSCQYRRIRAELAGHLAECLRHFEDGMRRNLDTHGGDLVPVGDLLAHGERWGIDPAEMAALLVGASAATLETARLLRPVAVALVGAETDPATIDDVRALGADAARAVDAWIEGHAWRLVTSDDIDRPSLAELPELQLRTLLAAVEITVTPTGPEAVAARVPADQRALFTSLLAGRAEERDRVEAMPPPRSLGAPEPPPPLDALPAPMARATRAVMATLTADITAPQTEPLRGTGVGDHPYRGRACVVSDRGEAAELLEPGDVLVTPFTGPAANSLLPLLGALVVEEGGSMCHAAIVAREFGLRRSSAPWGR